MWSAGGASRLQRPGGGVVLPSGFFKGVVVFLLLAAFEHAVAPPGQIRQIGQRGSVATASAGKTLRYS